MSIVSILRVMATIQYAVDKLQYLVKYGHLHENEPLFLRDGLLKNLIHVTLVANTLTPDQRDYLPCPWMLRARIIGEWTTNEHGEMKELCMVGYCPVDLLTKLYRYYKNSQQHVARRINALNHTHPSYWGNVVNRQGQSIEAMWTKYQQKHLSKFHVEDIRFPEMRYLIRPVPDCPTILIDCEYNDHSYQTSDKCQIDLEGLSRTLESHFGITRYTIWWVDSLDPLDSY